MISRRAFLIGAAVLATPLEAVAQQRNAGPRVGVIAQDVQPGLLETLRDELQQLGYVEGKSIVIDVRNAEGRSDRLSPLVADLLHLKVDVLVAVNTPAAKAAQSATKTVPIVIMRVADPVKSGLVRSLARPGENVTGVSFMPDVLGAKAVEALSQTIPTLSRVAAFYKADNPGALFVVTETERRSAELGVRFERLPIRDSRDFPDAFAAAARAGAQAVFVMDDGAMTGLRGSFLKHASQRSLPVASIYRDFAEAGGLFAYGPDLDHVYRRAAHYVARILRGAKPSELPVEQADTFHFVINLKTARALGLTIPPALLLRANQLIDQ
ncbi:MAG TPA: ABC transporter substrate-binding protein [Methylomirabilota bacterium]|nr:ABC transporter substrate-binding protein [Methylomirabilota bacterium]